MISKSIAHYIAEALRMEVVAQVEQSKFFSILLDVCTDSANAENESMMAVWFDWQGEDEKVLTRISY